MARQLLRKVINSVASRLRNLWIGAKDLPLMAVFANKVRTIRLTERGNAVTVLIYPAFVTL